MRLFAFLFGLIFLIIGIAGFVPGLVSHEHLGHVFHVNVWLNLLHTFFGLFGFLVAIIGRETHRFYFQATGVVFGFLAILGFVYGDRDILGFFASNSPDTWFHVIMAVPALILGFGGKD